VKKKQRRFGYNRKNKNSKKKLFSKKKSPTRSYYSYNKEEKKSPQRLKKIVEKAADRDFLRFFHQLIKIKDIIPTNSQKIYKRIKLIHVVKINITMIKIKI